MALNANRGQPPGEQAGAPVGAPAAITINLSNGKNVAQVGMRAKGIPPRPFQPAWWYLSSEPDGCTVAVDVLLKAHGSGAFTTILGGPLTHTSPATENDGDASGWSGALATDWIEARLTAVTVGSPKQVSLTIHGTYV